MPLYVLAMGLWLGILTSISPCPLATNIAAISFISRRVGNTRNVLLSGLMYAFGRSLVYVALGLLLVHGLLSAPGVSDVLQRYINRLLGPALVLTGMFLTGLLSVSARGFGVSNRIQQRAEQGGVLGAGLLGVAFALSFCPISAALFFGSLIPLSVKHLSRIALPSAYGVGTALPVVGFSLVIAISARRVAMAFDRLKQVEKWARLATGWILIAAGVYLSLAYIFEVL